MRAMPKGRLAAAGLAVLLLMPPGGPARADSPEPPPPAPPPATSPAGAPADDPSPDPPYRLLSARYWKGYLSDTGRLATAPARWDRGDWRAFGFVAAAATGLYFADREIRDRAQKNRTDLTDDLADGAERLGNGLYLVPAIGFHYAYGRLAADERACRASLLALESLALSGLLTAAGKVATHRHRPDTGAPYDTWDGPGGSTDSDELSFPSGHSASAFSVATVAALEYADVPWVPPVAYGLAAAAALSRVHDDEHWASDAFVGSAVGFFTARAIVNAHRGRAGGGGGMVLVPLFDGERAGLFLTRAF